MRGNNRFSLLNEKYANMERMIIFAFESYHWMKVHVKLILKNLIL